MFNILIGLLLLATACLIYEYYPLARLNTAKKILRWNKILIDDRAGYLRCSRHTLKTIRTKNLKNHKNKKVYRWCLTRRPIGGPAKSFLLDKKRGIYLSLEKLYSEDYYADNYRSGKK